MNETLKNLYDRFYTPLTASELRIRTASLSNG